MENRIRFLLEAKALLAVARSKKGQGSLEYIMMLAAASLVIAIALAMVVKLKGAATSNIMVNGSNMSISGAISHELSSLSSNVV
ncbi:MAG: class III signal peptide-containing protein [Candidatus Micrarchaeota archaeon]|nr:class III signal peptide-containing protein [Candidatus Micrarchaeota archaeon]MDE1846510.1 class III signal peptide-containing protein [Candidatus Micrarchaeota archaeon]